MLTIFDKDLIAFIVMTHSITIRPCDGIRDEQIAMVVVWLNKLKKNYIYSIEKENEERHMHIRLDKMKRTDNITRSLKTIFKVQRTDKQWHNMLDIKVHNDPDYLTGYVCKDGSWVTFGFNELDIAKARLYYEETKLKSTSNKSIHLGNFDIEAENYCRANAIDMKTTELCSILGQMYISGEYRMNQFLFRHMKIPVTKLWLLRRTKNPLHVQDNNLSMISQQI